MKQEIRTNTYDEETGEITVSEIRAEAIDHVREYYDRLFGDDPRLDDYREDIAITSNTVPKVEDRHKLSAEDLIDNEPANSLLIWSFVSVIFLIAAAGAMVWYYAVLRGKDKYADKDVVPAQDPLLDIKMTSSMKAIYKYVWLVVIMMVVQVGLGIVTAHYAVEGGALYGIPIAEWFPYVVTRTWHQQLSVFWIATAWHATGLYFSPAILGYDPKHQRFGVNFLFV